MCHPAPTRSYPRRAAAALLVWAAGSAVAADPAPPARPDSPRDAAEAVQEGNVKQWVEYYERMRGGRDGRAPAEAGRATTPDPREPAKPPR